MTTKKTMITEIDLYELTDKQFQALGELLGEDPLEMGALDVQPIHVVYSPGQDLTVVRYMKNAADQRQSTRPYPRHHDRWYGGTGFITILRRIQ